MTCSVALKVHDGHTRGKFLVQFKVFRWRHPLYPHIQLQGIYFQYVVCSIGLLIHLFIQDSFA